MADVNCDPITKELPILPVYKGEQEIGDVINADVLVIGGGYAGINAAYMAKKAGARVVLVDKGRPGFSGQSAFPGTFHFVDKEMGDDIEALKEKIRIESDGLANLDWLDIFINESKETYERLKGWGLFERHPRFCETEFWQENDAKGYRKKYVGNRDRRFCFVRMLDDNQIPWYQHIMINKIIVSDGRCQGAVGLQVTTGKIIRFNAKSVVLACGNGVISPGTFCVGGNTFDGEYMAYELGLKIGGKEYEDFHSACSFAPGNAWINTDTSYLDSIYLCGGWYDQEDNKNIQKNRESEAKLALKEALHYRDFISEKEFDESEVTVESAKVQSKVYGINPNEVRTGKYMSPRFHAYGEGAAIGMCLHLSSGIYCGMEEFNGFTGIPGIYCAGDGIQLTQVSGAGYFLGNGSTSCFVSICGARAGKSAAEYAVSVADAVVPDGEFVVAKEEIEAPLKVQQGFDPNWAKDVLMGIMAPYWVSRNKSEDTLKAAITNVEYMRDHVVPKLMARTSHGQKLCLEMQHKVLSSELKLKASLARKESRGMYFRRDDYPETKEEYRGYILLEKNSESMVTTSFVPAKEEWL